RSEAEQRLSKLRQTKAKEIVRSISPFVIAAALVTLAIWTYQLVWPAPPPVPAVLNDPTKEADREWAALRGEQLRQAAASAQAKLGGAEREQERLKDELQRQAKAAGDAQTKLQSELQIQARAAKDADTKRLAAEKAAADAEAERRRLAAKLE